MKTGLAFASLVSMVAAGCDLSASYKTMWATCSFPRAEISDDCCAYAQAQVTKFFSDPDANPDAEIDEAAQKKLKQICPHFHGPPDMKCTEYSHPDGEAVETGCSLHSNFPGVSISCDIPGSTTISSDCCVALQSTISEKADSLPARVGQTMMMKCPSVMAWGQARMADLGPPPQEHSSPSEKLDYIAKALPVGLSCTEERPSGMSQGIINAVLKMSESINDAELESQPAASSPSLIPMIAVAGAAGVLGGLVAFFAGSKASSKSHRAALISDDA